MVENPNISKRVLPPDEDLGLELPSKAFCNKFNLASFKFYTTDELPETKDVIDQIRAFRAMILGSTVTRPATTFSFSGSLALVKSRRAGKWR